MQELDLQNAGGAQAEQTADKKVKISFDEFSKLAFLIASIMKDLERSGHDNVRQGDIVEKMVQKLELENTERVASLERTAETAKKVKNVINYLINNEGVLMISQDAKTKDDRYLTLSTNLDLQNFAGTLQGALEPGY